MSLINNLFVEWNKRPKQNQHSSKLIEWTEEEKEYKKGVSKISKERE